MSPEFTFCMKCQSLFPGKNRKNILKCLLKVLPRVLSVKIPSANFKMSSAKLKNSVNVSCSNGIHSRNKQYCQLCHVLSFRISYNKGRCEGKTTFLHLYSKDADVSLLISTAWLSHLLSAYTVEILIKLFLKRQ